MMMERIVLKNLAMEPRLAREAARGRAGRTMLGVRPFHRVVSVCESECAD
jgi:hypothetical protein